MKKTKIEILKDIALNLKTLIDSDLTSVEETITLSEDLEDIMEVIENDQKVESIKK